MFKRKHKSVLICFSVMLCIISTTCLSITTASAKDNNSLSNFTIELSEEAQDAINNGVPLTLQSEYAKAIKWFWLPLHIDKKQHQFILMRHALSNRYLVQQDNTDAPKNFRSITEALDFVAYQAILLLESYNDQTDRYKMRVHLNKFKLPSPMRLNAFLSKAWNYDSGWIHWQLSK